MAAKTTKKNPTHKTPRKTSPVLSSEKVLVKWKANSRPFTKRTKEYWVSTFAIAALAGFILLIIEGFVSVLLVIAIVFLFYVLNTVEPTIIEYQITTDGIYIGDDFVGYPNLIRFWFRSKNNDDLLIFEITTIPRRLEIVINKKDKSRVRKALSQYLVEEEAAPTRTDNAIEWISHKLPTS